MFEDSRATQILFKTRQKIDGQSKIASCLSEQNLDKIVSVTHNTTPLGLEKSLLRSSPRPKNYMFPLLVAGTVLIPLQIATKLSTTKSERIYWKINTGKKNFSKSTDIRGSYLLTSTGHITHLGCMAGTDSQETSMDISRFSKIFSFLC